MVATNTTGSTVLGLVDGLGHSLGTTPQSSKIIAVNGNPDGVVVPFSTTGSNLAYDAATGTLYMSLSGTAFPWINIGSTT